MNPNIFKVSVAIPAYNEGANIKNLLLDLLTQSCDNFILQEILVVSDGSTDNTVLEAKSINNPLIKIYDDGQRKGKAPRQNEILKLFTGDILVLLDADTLLGDTYFLHYMIDPFNYIPKLGITSNPGKPVEPDNLFEKILIFSLQPKDYIYEHLNNQDNIYLCHGHSRAFSRSFTSNLKWEQGTGEDAFSYLYCKKEGFKFLYQPKALLYYKLTSNMKDYLNQSVRFINSKEALKDSFGDKAVKDAFHIPFSLKLKACIYYFLKNPFYFFSYILILSIAHTNAPSTPKPTGIWASPTSSKKLKR